MEEGVPDIKAINGFLLFKKLILCMLLVTVFTVPRTLQIAKFAMLFILMLGFLAENKVRMRILLLCGVYALLFLFPSVVGILNSNQYSYIFNVIRISLFFPIVLLIILQQFDFYQLIKIIERAALISIFLIFLIFLSSLFNAFGLFAYNINQWFYPEEAFVGIHDGYIHIVNSSLSYFIFIIPLFFWGDKFDIRHPNVYIFFIMLTAAIVSGRRIMLLPFMLIFLLNIKKVLLPLIAILCMALLFVNKEVYADFKLEAIVDRFKDALDESGDSEVRGEQTRHFKQYIAERPIIGYGLGAYMHDYIRSKKMPFAYEKTWDYQVFSMGIPTTVIHVLFFLFLMFLVYRNKVLTVINARFRNALIIATLSLLVASNTNPYWLSSFDYSFPLAFLFRFSQES